MSDEKIPLPDGGWALLRDPRRVSERRRRPVTHLQAKLMASEVGALLTEKERRTEAAKAGDEAAAKAIDDWYTDEARKLMGTDAYDLIEQLDDALIEALVAEWSYDSVPSADAAIDLPGDAYKALKEHCAKLLPALSVGFNPAEVGDEQSPTVASPA